MEKETGVEKSKLMCSNCGWRFVTQGQIVIECPRCLRRADFEDFIPVNNLAVGGHPLEKVKLICPECEHRFMTVKPSNPPSFLTCPNCNVRSGYGFYTIATDIETAPDRPTIIPPPSPSPSTLSPPTHNLPEARIFLTKRTINIYMVFVGDGSNRVEVELVDEGKNPDIFPVPLQKTKI